MISTEHLEEYLEAMLSPGSPRNTGKHPALA
jgi:hypothetical protein